MNGKLAKDDLVQVRGKETLSYYGRVKEFLSNDRVIVGFKEPHQPQSCGACGSPFALSVNAGTGEIVCMRSGCGHEHGYRHWDEVVDVSDVLENITNQREHNAKHT